MSNKYENIPELPCKRQSRFEVTPRTVHFAFLLIILLAPVLVVYGSTMPLPSKKKHNPSHPQEEVCVQQNNQQDENHQQQQHEQQQQQQHEQQQQENNEHKRQEKSSSVTCVTPEQGTGTGVAVSSEMSSGRRWWLSMCNRFQHGGDMEDDVSTGLRYLVSGVFCLLVIFQVGHAIGHLMDECADESTDRTAAFLRSIALIFYPLVFNLTGALGVIFHGFSCFSSVALVSVLFCILIQETIRSSYDVLPDQGGADSPIEFRLVYLIAALTAGLALQRFGTHAMRVCIPIIGAFAITITTLHFRKHQSALHIYNAVLGRHWSENTDTLTPEDESSLLVSIAITVPLICAITFTILGYTRIWYLPGEYCTAAVKSCSRGCRCSCRRRDNSSGNRSVNSQRQQQQELKKLSPV